MKLKLLRRPTAPKSFLRPIIRKAHLFGHYAKDHKVNITDVELTTARNKGYPSIWAGGKISASQMIISIVKFRKERTGI